MHFQFTIRHKSAIDLKITRAVENPLPDMIREAVAEGHFTIPLTPAQQFRGKRVEGLKLVNAEDGEYFSVENHHLVLEFEEEMLEEFALFIESAIKEEGFETPEIMEFHSRKGHKDPGMTIYGVLVAGIAPSQNEDSVPEPSSN